MQGIIIKAIAGFYYIAADDTVFECKARGKFRNKLLTPLVGDFVDIEKDNFSVASDPSMVSGTIERVYPRKNEFDRPPIANVDVCIIVSAYKNPLPLTYIIDRMCVSAEMKDCEIVICLNKSDLTDNHDFASIYKNTYPVFSVCASTGEGIEGLKEYIKGKKAVLAGPSGVGKSSLTNLLLENEEASEVGIISDKTLRGKNTTRHSELFIGKDFSIFDTPGFTSFDAPELQPEELDKLFPDFKDYLGKCRFDNCRHISEPDCAVKNALFIGRINDERYNSYAAIYKEIKERRKY